MVAGENFGELVTLRIWRGKLWRIAMNHLYPLQFKHTTHTPCLFKATIIYFIITCGAKMVWAFVVRG